MAEQWPVSLQEKLNEANFGLTIGPTSITSKMDVGLDKTRQRYTKGIDIFSCSINLNNDDGDYTTFDNFFKVTLAYGTKTFEFNHPLTGVLTEFRFKNPSENPPKYSPLGGTYFRLDMIWEEMP